VGAHLPAVWRPHRRFQLLVVPVLKWFGVRKGDWAVGVLFAMSLVANLTYASQGTSPAWAGG
jgi:hypothetical protein